MRILPVFVLILTVACGTPPPDDAAPTVNDPPDAGPLGTTPDAGTPAWGEIALETDPPAPGAAWVGSPSVGAACGQTSCGTSRFCCDPGMVEAMCTSSGANVGCSAHWWCDGPEDCASGLVCWRERVTATRFNARCAGRNEGNSNEARACNTTADCGALETCCPAAGATGGLCQREACLQCPVAPYASCDGVDLHGLDLSGRNALEASFSGANLAGANLSGAELEGANLVGAKLVRANLTRTKLENADLSGADLRQATFGLTSLWWTNLTNADLRGAHLAETTFNFLDLTGARFDGADLRNVSWHGVTCPDGEPAVSTCLGHLAPKP